MASIEEAKLELERRRLDMEAEQRAREFDLRAVEVSAARGRELGITGTQATVIVAAISMASAAIGAAITGYFQREAGDIKATGDLSVEETRAQAQIDLERLKFESSLILKAIEQQDQNERIKALRFFANAGLIPTHKDDILKLAEEDQGKQIPALGQEPQTCPFSKSRLTFSVADNVPSPAASALTNILKSVYERWSDATGLTIIQLPQGQSGDISIEYNEREFPGVLGYSEFPCDGQAKMFLSADRDWSVASAHPGADRDSRFMYTVLLHEAGHTLGLNHVAGSGAVMSMPPPNLTELTDQDVAAARRLYAWLVASRGPR